MMEEFHRWLKDFIEEVFNNGSSTLDDTEPEYDKGYVIGYRDAIMYILETIESEDYESDF